MMVFRCEGFAEADALSSQDPFVICGVVSYKVLR
jgi:hypothetical protein